MHAPLFWTLTLFGAAVAVAVLEVFLPSGGVLAIVAILCLIGSIFFAFQISTLVGSVAMFAVCLLIPLFLWAAVLVYPKTWIGRKILLEPANDPALAPDNELKEIRELTGKEGIARSKMLLGGIVEIEGKQYNAVSDAESVEIGEPIEVLRIEGRSIIVRRKTFAAAVADIAVGTAEDAAAMRDPFALD